MRIDSTRLLTMQPELLELLKNLEVGDTLKGRVLEVLGNSIAIRTSSGQVFTAMLPEETSLPKGVFVELTVSSLKDGKIYAEFKTEEKEADADTKVTQLLKQIGLPTEERNIEAAKLLVKYKLPLDRETIVNITGIQKSIENLGNSVEGRVGLLLSEMDIKNTPVDVLNKIVLNWSEDNTKPVIMPDIVEHPELPHDAEADIVVAKAAQAVEAKAEQPEEQPESEAVIARTAMPADAEKPEAPVGSKASALIGALEKLGIETDSKVRSLTEQVSGILDSIKNADMEAITYLASKKLEATPKNIAMLINNIENKDGIANFVEKLQKRIETENDPKLAEVKESIKKVFLEPRQVENPKEVTEQLKDIARLGEKLESYLESNSKVDPDIKEALTNLRDTLDFIKTINQHNNYMQVPLLINNDTATAKLYVFKEGKRSREIDPENATILVALDLNSLGHLESMIGVKGKIVNVTFRVESKGIGLFIEKQGHMLKKSLEEKGYSLNPIRIINLEQPFSLLSLEELINGEGSGKIHFDMRV